MIGIGSAGPRLAPEPDGPGRRPRSEAGWSGIDLGHLDPDGERPYWVAIAQVPGVGPASFGRLLARHGSAHAAWAAGEAILDDVPRHPEEARHVLARLRRAGPARVVRRVETAMRAVGGVVMTALDPTYPQALRAVEPRPPVLYAAGDLDALQLPAVAVVGTRRATGYGRSCAMRIADELARARVVVVSGLAIGVDGVAHAAAVDAGGRSIAVLPSPLDRIYPPRHRELAARLAATGGALVSEIAPGQSLGKPDFARRNRIIAGLSAATVVIEAPDRSGALLTAAAAGELGREVYAVPGPIDVDASRGCNRLIADHHATLLTSPAALLASVGVSSAGRVPDTVATLSDAEALVLANLLKRPASLDELLRPTELAAGALAGALTLLEARNLVTSYGGATFHPTLSARRLIHATPRGG